MEYIILATITVLAIVILFTVWFFKQCKREDKEMWERVFPERYSTVSDVPGTDGTT